MGQGVKRTQRDYSLTFKLSLVEQIEKGELTYKQAQVCYGIQCSGLIIPDTILGGTVATMT